MNIKQCYAKQFTAGATGIIDIDLGSGGVNIIQSIYIYFNNVVGANSFVMGTWDGTNFYPFASEATTKATGTNFSSVSRAYQIINPYQYIQIQYTGNTADILGVSVGYFQIPGKSWVQKNERPENPRRGQLPADGRQRAGRC